MLNTPLMLAVKCRRKDCVRVLCDHLADPHYKPFKNCINIIYSTLGLSPIEYAVAEKDIELLVMLVGAAPRSKANNFETYKESLADALEAIPDFSMEMCFNCDSSFIPFVKSFAPSDVYKVRNQFAVNCRFTKGRTR